MKRFLLAAALAAVTLLDAGCASNGDMAASGPDTPSATGTARSTASATPTTSAAPTTGATSTGTSPANPPGGGGGGGAPANPPAATTPPAPATTPPRSTPPPPPPPPPADNSEACTVGSFALLRTLSFEISLGIIANPDATEEGRAQARQTLLNNVQIARDLAQEAAGLTTDPALSAVLNTFIQTFNATAAVVPTGTPEEIVTALATPAFDAALNEFDRLCA
jgi:hypothetical protein